MREVDASWKRAIEVVDLLAACDRENNRQLNELENKFITLLNECEIVRYSPSSNKHLQMDSFLIKAKNIIIEVENSLR